MRLIDLIELENPDLRHEKAEEFSIEINNVGYTATPVTFGWAGALFEVSLSFRQEQ